MKLSQDGPQFYRQRPWVRQDASTDPNHKISPFLQYPSHTDMSKLTYISNAKLTRRLGKEILTDGETS